MEIGCTLWFTGMSGSGKSTLATMLAAGFRRRGLRVELLDGDVVRSHLCRDLGFSREDREENVRRIGFLCELLTRNGVIAIAAAISPYRAGRDALRGRISRFAEIYMACPLDVLIQRDVKGMYKKALAGEISEFTGVSAPYEPPVAPDITIDSSTETPEASVEHILSRLSAMGFVAQSSEADPDEDLVRMPILADAPECGLA